MENGSTPLPRQETQGRWTTPWDGSIPFKNVQTNFSNYSQVKQVKKVISTNIRNPSLRARISN